MDGVNIQHQAPVIIRHLIKYGTITSYDAISLYHVTRLSAVIFNLRRLGYCIETVKKAVDTGYGKTMIAVYTLREPVFVGVESNRID